MKQRGLLIVSVILTVFVLSVVGGVVRASVVSMQYENASLKTQVAKIQATYTARDGEYQKMIDQANREISSANENMQGLVNQVKMHNAGGATPIPPAAQSSGAQVPVDVARVTALAAAAENSQMTKEPEIVNYSGELAYEVAFDTGMIYINAQDGRILFNGTIPHAIDSEVAGQIAKNYLGGTGEITKTEKITVNGKVLWRSISSAGHMVYVDTDGQVVYVQMNNPSGG